MGSEIEPFYRELGRRIRDLRTSKGLTQEELGELLDPPVTRASIANIETGAQRVLAHTLAQFATHLETTVQALLPLVVKKDFIAQDDVNMRNELSKQLKIPSKLADRLVRRLASGGKS